MKREDIFTIIETINIDVAEKMVDAIIHCTKFDGKPDIVAVVLGVDNRILCLKKSGNNPLLVSDSWAVKKALTAIAFGASTVSLAAEKPTFDVGDNFCKCPGGILIPSSKWSGWLYKSFEQMPKDGSIKPFSGAIGVSGRSSKEDHQLAIDGLTDFIKSVRGE